MNAMMFEDKVSSSLSQLLLHVNSSILFTNGNQNLEDGIKTWNKTRNDGDFLIVFCDVVPDNFKTIQAYNKAFQCLSVVKNVILLPIPCIEYYCIDAWLAGTHDHDLVFKYTDRYWFNNSNSRRRGLSTKSFEKYCKSVLHSSNNCFNNGLFYSVSCRCKNGIDRDICNKELSLDLKGKMLYNVLPLKIAIDEDNRLKFISELQEIIDRQYNFYYYLVRSFIDNGKISPNGCYEIERYRLC